MLLDDLTDYLSSGGCGTRGTDLFAGEMPDTPAGLLTVLEYGGLPGEHAMASGPGQAVLERPYVQVQSRDTTYTGARLRLAEAGLLLDGLRVREINGILYHWIAALQPLFFLRRDENRRVLFAQNFAVVREGSTSS